MRNAEFGIYVQQIAQIVAVDSARNKIVRHKLLIFLVEPAVKMFYVVGKRAHFRGGNI